jgi:GT2 family glycosyltransferase
MAYNVPGLRRRYPYTCDSSWFKEFMERFIMRASLIIASHNEGERLVKTIQSCVETCSDLDHEIIVADDASTDHSINQLRARFPHVRLVSHPKRKGASPTKTLGARHARGEVLVFLDGHCKPERDAVRRLVEDVELLDGAAVVTPRVASLDTHRWETDLDQAGNGYYLKLDRFDCGWLEKGKLRAVREGRRRFYESPSLCGCALAVSRELFDRLRGFDPHMRYWGVEDLDFGLKCWLLGARILHDPRSVVGHRFRASFDNFSVPAEHVVVNQLRMARKNFTPHGWSRWLESCRTRHEQPLANHPEGLWARVWELFLKDRPSVEEERAYLHSRRIHDEFWFADRFGLAWPKLSAPGKKPCKCGEKAHGRLKADPSDGPDPSDAPEPTATPSPYPSRSPSPKPKKCQLEGIEPDDDATCVNTALGFTADGEYLTEVQWTAIGGNPYYGTGPTFSTRWSEPGQKTVSARCGRSSYDVQISVGKLEGISPDDTEVCVDTPVTFTADGESLDAVEWSAPDGDPEEGTGPEFTTQWSEPGEKQVTASCDVMKTASVRVGSLDSIDPTDPVIPITDSVTFTAEGQYTGGIDWEAPDATPDRGSGSEFSASWKDPGEYTVTAYCGDAQQQADVKAVKVTFDQALLRTGFIKGGKGATIVKTIKATVVPASAVQKIDLATTGKAGAIALSQVTKHEDGTITAQVVAKQKSSKADGDASVVAKLGTKELASVAVVVLVPSAIGRPHDTPSGAVQPKNVVADKTSSPPWPFPLGANKVVLATIYAQVVTVRVVDQFGQPLDDVYRGAYVEEQLAKTKAWRDIYQRLDGSGEYKDPVFAWSYKNGGGNQPAGAAKSTYDRNSDDAKAWPYAELKSLIPNDFDSQNIPVRVGGHQLTDGIQGRTISAVAPDIINISWP